MEWVFNKTAQKLEEARLKVCPNCKGHGGTFSDPDDVCRFCLGEGDVWISESGWMRPSNSSEKDHHLTELF